MIWPYLILASTYLIVGLALCTFWGIEVVSVAQRGSPPIPSPKRTPDSLPRLRELNCCLGSIKIYRCSVTLFGG